LVWPVWPAAALLMQTVVTSMALCTRPLSQFFFLLLLNIDDN
jgi:hypothetical protein